MYFLHEADTYLNMMQTCRSSTQQERQQSVVYVLAFLQREDTLSLRPVMSSRSRVYCVISAQMLVGRAVAQDEHNSIITHYQV